MAVHISARVAWHDNGWNGSVCKNPRCNTYCAGAHSYPGQKIAENRDIDMETQENGKPFTELKELPPCLFSANAFNSMPQRVFDDRPDFFHSGDRAYWDMPPYTICTWPYEAMYDDSTKDGNSYDAVKRLELTEEYFNAISPGQSLVFPYVNYSNPLSEEDCKRYLVIGVSRIHSIGDLNYYPNLGDEDIKKYGGYVWERNVTMDYENEGFRIPYHLYLDKPEILERLAVYPDNDRRFKYATRHLSDDDALSLVERFIEVCSYLIHELHDTSEDWNLRLKWLQGLLAELWASRGLFPGFARVMTILGLHSGVADFKKAVIVGREKEFKTGLIDWLSGKEGAVPGWNLLDKEGSAVKRQWQLRDKNERDLLSDILPLFDLDEEQFKTILSPERNEWGIDANLDEVIDDPFLICEMYEGTGPDDGIAYAKIEHGVYPSPHLGGEALYGTDDWRRFRALCVDKLKRETKHAFIASGLLLQEINNWLSLQPDWKRVSFKEAYFEVDKNEIEKALVLRKNDGRNYVYLKSVYQAERAIEEQLRELAGRPEIIFKTPITLNNWQGYLRNVNSSLVTQAPKEYEQGINSQAGVCDQIFRKPLSVICGSAGTGKTTVVESIIKAIQKAHGADTSFCLLAPTGKAADRMRDKTGKDASTIHSFLMKHGWLRENMRPRIDGGKREDGISTYIIDESSMLDLELTACFFRSVNWNSVQRLIFVGDPNQLPPIGKGRVFADLICWLKKDQPECVGELNENLRQLVNKVEGNGTGILDVASLYIVDHVEQESSMNEARRVQAEEFLKKLQNRDTEGNVDKDLRILYWSDAKDLHKKIREQMITDMEVKTKEKLNTEKPWELWDKAWANDKGGKNPLYQQILSPYRNEEYGTSVLNDLIQEEARGSMKERVGLLGGITLFDKVIQYRNRGSSEPIYAYNWNTSKNEKSNVFNGEIGMVEPCGYDKWWVRFFKFDHFSVKFARKEHLGFMYSKGKDKPEDNLELAYAISVHKAQGSEFERVYFVLPKKEALLSPELLYTGLTRATNHCTVFVEGDVSSLLKMHRPENSHLLGINSSLFDIHVVPDEFASLRKEGFLEEYRIHRSLANIMVRSKSEVIISNMLFDRDIPFYYEKPLYARDGSFYLPDFTINWRGEEYYWEHLGLLDQDKYRNHWKQKKDWYDEHFPGKLITTEESGNLSLDAESLINKTFIAGTK
jgi:ATP-dependent exoDNAse (exonuclease V) alpha subunit